ncbi:MDR family MFS transporter [Sporosalibacterium faouarense]|uniref:MDR family MFS transporter n=1 Tax=Sporosalibacterium faouarense TaxID=516123 RepID=UPI00141C6333|nr:MFS transporter [Sporosalibacterium faouarense]MTI49608.1 MFS transporter [Bacillota bacterium]
MSILKKRVFNVFDTYRGLPRSIYFLFFARVINSMGAFVYPFLTFFLTDKMGLSEQETGFYFILVAVMSVPGSFLGGYLSDHFGRKKIMIIFQGLSAISFVPCAFLGNSMMVPWLLIAATFFGGAAQPANSAMVADITNNSNRKQSYSLLYLGINVGYAIGPLIAGFLYENYTYLIFLGDALTTLISLILIVVFVSESKPTEEKINESYEVDHKERAEKGGLLEVLLRRPALIAFAMVATVYSFVYVQHSYSIPLQVKDLFGAETGSKMYGTLMTTNALVVVFMTSFITKITIRLKPIQNIALSGIMNAIGFGMLLFAHSYPIFIISTVIWTIGEILNVTNSGVYIANHTPMSHRGRFNSILPLLTGAGYAFGPYIMGGIIENHGIRTAWPITFVLAMIGATFMYILYLFEKRKEEAINKTA